MADEKACPFEMRLLPEWLAMIDDWRQKQLEIPASAEAVRWLVEKGLRNG